MTRPIIFLVNISIICLAFANTPSRSAKDTVEQFVKMDVEGERLTREGWEKANVLFSKPSAHVQPKLLIVIGRYWAVSAETTNGAAEQYYFGYEEVGRLDVSSLRFTPTVSTVEHRSFDRYTLVWKRSLSMDADKRSGDQQGTPGWRMEGSQPPTMHLTAEAAMRFVTQMRSKVTDPVIQKNADGALLKLARYR